MKSLLLKGMSYGGSNMSSREESNNSSSRTSVSLDASSFRTMGVEMEVIIENKEDPTEEHVES